MSFNVNHLPSANGTASRTKSAGMRYHRSITLPKEEEVSASPVEVVMDHRMSHFRP